MVKQNLNHTMYFVLGVLAIITVLKYNLHETIWQKSHQDILQKQKKYQVVITEDELKDFIRLWPEFCELGLGNDFSFSSQVEYVEDMVDWKNRLWFVYHHLDPQRFFYVQQRVDYLLNAINIKRDSQALITQLSQQKNLEKSKITKEMIEFQKKRYEAEEITETEKKLLDEYEATLRDLLAKYPLSIRNR